jgi:hypothetical protein
MNDLPDLAPLRDAVDTAFHALPEEIQAHTDRESDAEFLRVLTRVHVWFPSSPWGRYVDARLRLIAAKMEHAIAGLQKVGRWNTWPEDTGMAAAMSSARTLHYDMAGWAAETLREVAS